MKNGQELLDALLVEVPHWELEESLEETFGSVSLKIRDDDCNPMDFLWVDPVPENPWGIKLERTYFSESGGGYRDEDLDTEDVTGTFNKSSSDEDESESSFRKWVEEKFPEEFKKITTPD